jgi:hypothetical protein
VVLDGDDRDYGACSGKLPLGDVRYADMADLALPLKVYECTYRILDRCCSPARAKIGDKALAKMPPARAAAVLDRARAMIEDAVDRMKTEAGDVTLIAVGAEGMPTLTEPRTLAAQRAALGGGFPKADLGVALDYDLRRGMSTRPLPRPTTSLSTSSAHKRRASRC